MNALAHFPQALESVFQAVLAASWQGSLAILLVLVVRQLLGFRAAARWHYLLWCLAILRLLVPAFVLPHSPASIENIPAVAHPFARGPLPEIHESVSAGASAKSPRVETPESRPSLRHDAQAAASHSIRKPMPWQQWAALAWLAGAITLGAWFAVCALRFSRRLRRDSVPVTDDIQAIWTAGCRRWLRGPTPRIFAVDWIASPALLGIWRPALLIPRQSLASFSAEDWEHVFAHEIAHLRSRDHWSQLLLMLALCVHWFNPVVWVGLRRLRVDRELAADEWALQHLEGERSLAYGETLFKTLLSRPGNLFQPGMVGISEDGAQMKQRMRRITARLPRRIYGSLAGLAALSALSLVLLGQSSTPPAIPPAPSAKTPDEKPAALSLQPAKATPHDVSGEILAAARAGDSMKLSAILSSGDTDARSGGQRQAVQVLEDLLIKRELPSYTLLLDEIQKVPIGKSWRVSDPDLASLVKEGRIDFLDALLARRLDLERLRQEAKSGEPAMVEWINRRIATVAKQRADLEALEQAAAAGDLPALRQLVGAGADVNGVGKDDNTPLLRAVIKDRLEAAQFLLDHGAEVDKPRFPGWDYTPLCLAHSVKMAELLKKAGANLHAKLFSRDVSILTYVAREGDSDLVAWSIRQGLNPKMTGDNHQTLLYYLSDAHTAKLLLDAGVDPNHLDEFGQTAITTARNAEVAQELIDHGAKLRDLPEPLLPRMVYSSTAGAMEAVLKAGADQDPATLQKTLTRLDRRSESDFPEKEKLRKLLIALGAKPATDPVEPETYYKGNVSTEDHAFIDSRSVLVNCYIAFANPTSVSSMQEQAYVDTDGSFLINVRDNATTVTLSLNAEGYATTYAGPFTPPLAEKLAGLRLMLSKGYSAAIQIVDGTGKPIAGAKVQGYYPGPPKTDLAKASSDASGTAVLNRLGETPLDIQVSADGYEADEVIGIRLDPARLTLKKAQPLTGTITSAATGQPIAGAVIKLAGVRGPQQQTYPSPTVAPLLATADVQGRFTLDSLRSDSVYFLFAEAPKYGGVFLSGIRTGQPELKIALGQELTVQGKIVNIPAGLMHRGKFTVGYDQYFKIGEITVAAGVQVPVAPVHGEADFTIGPLYANPVEIDFGGKGMKLDAKELPKAGLVIDLAK